jgi:hypothetical protein
MAASERKRRYQDRGRASRVRVACDGEPMKWRRVVRSYVFRDEKYYVRQPLAEPSLSAIVSPGDGTWGRIEH